MIKRSKNHVKYVSQTARFVSKIETKIVLIDGNQLSEYMIDKNIGVTLEKSYLLKKLDLDYFEDT